MFAFTGVTDQGDFMCKFVTRPATDVALDDNNGFQNVNFKLC